MEWSATRGEDGLGSLDVNEAEGDITEERLISVVDLFCRCVSFCIDMLTLLCVGKHQFVLQVLNTDPAITSSLIQQGLVPCAPSRPHITISIPTLEIYQVIRMRCPHLGIQAFVKMLCDVHHVSLTFISFDCSHPMLQRLYKLLLTHQFTVAFNVYMSILDSVDLKVHVALNRDGPGWQLQNACPCCTYCLQDEPKLRYSMLFSVDGNNSLKHLLRRDQGSTDDGMPGPSSERFDDC